MIFIGDVHGNYNKLYETIEKFQNKTFIQVGDFGIGFDKKNDIQSLLDLNAHLKENGSDLFVIRGNHDDPAYWDGSYEFTNLYLVPDYTEIFIENKKVLFIGGGVSIDRVERKVNKSWWVDETIKYKEDINKCDILVTHVPLMKKFHDISEASSSNLINRFANKELRILNSDLYSDLNKEQLRIEYIFEKANPKWWISGHMHNSHRVYDDKKNFIILDIDEFFELSFEK